MRAESPSIVRAALWIGKVERGEMLRDVQGTGKLVPERTRRARA